MRTSPLRRSGNRRTRALRAVAVCAAAALVAAAGLAAASPFGINVHLGPPRALDKIVGDGIEWVRIDFVWAFVATAPDELDWWLYDTVIDRIEERGFRIYATLAGTPEWATDGEPLAGVPRDPDRWADFCYRAAARYRGRVDAWGVWNEPNLERFWQGSRAAFIEDMLQPALAAIAAADPDALRAGPDLAHLQNAHWDDWLTEILREASGGLDVVAHHAYPSGGSADEVVDKLNRDARWPWEDDPVRRILQRSGWWGRPFWLTETGSQSGTFSQGRQALFYRSVVYELFDPVTGLGWVDRVFFYELNDTTDPSLTWGILRAPPEFEPKLAATFYRNAIATATVDDSELVSRSAPLTVKPFSELTVQAIVHNTGTTSWSADDGYRLVPIVAWPSWTVPEMPLPSGRIVRPGATVELEARIEVTVDRLLDAPETVIYRLARPDGTPFGDPIRFDLWVTDEQAPEIVGHPGTVITAAGGGARFEVVAEGPDLRYRWQHNGRFLTGSDTVLGVDTAELTLLEVVAGDAGDYRCVVTNGGALVASEPGRLEVPDDRSGGAAPRRAGDRRGPDPQLIGRWTRLRSHAAGERASPDNQER